MPARILPLHEQKRQMNMCIDAKKLAFRILVRLLPLEPGLSKGRLRLRFQLVETAANSGR